MNFMPMIGKLPNKVLGDRVFEFWFRCDVDDKYKSVWFLRFYKSISYYCTTWPKA